LADFVARMEMGKGLSTQLRLENIFNKDYNEILGYASKGRGLYLMIRYAW